MLSYTMETALIFGDILANTCLEKCSMIAIIFVLIKPSKLYKTTYFLFTKQHIKFYYLNSTIHRVKNDRRNSSLCAIKIVYKNLTRLVTILNYDVVGGVP